MEGRVLQVKRDAMDGDEHCKPRNFQHLSHPAQFHPASGYSKPNFALDPALQDHSTPGPPSPIRSPLSQKNNDYAEAPLVSENEITVQWSSRKEAQWDIVGPVRKGGKEPQPRHAPEARGVPKMWAQNLYDAQDVLPYFSVSQTILTSKAPRVPARSVLLTRNLQNIDVDWREGKINFSVQLRFKHHLTRSDGWNAPNIPTGYPLKDTQHKPPDPIQFRKLIACYKAGVPVRVLATGDFPTLPVPQIKTYGSEEGAYEVGSQNWQQGVVVLGFFWVTRIQEIEHSTESFKPNTGKCSGRSMWEFEFTHCSGAIPPWWCPFPPEDAESEGGSEHGSPSKRRCTGTTSGAHLPPAGTMSKGRELDMDEADNGEDAPDEFQVSPRGIPFINSSGTRDDDISASLPMQVDPSPTQNPPVPEVLPNNPPPPRIQPSALGMSLEPHEWGDQDSIRPPQIRASLLMGWHCATCGKLNPRIKWTHEQSCSLCKTITNERVQPEWHRKAHTEAVGPIGTLYRLDDGGHQPKTGLHQMAARDLDNGLTCVEYWLADPPMPIIAELNRDQSMGRKGKGRQKKAPTKTHEVSSTHSMSTLSISPIPGLVPVPETSLAPNTMSTSQATDQSSPRHPDGGAIKRDRDAAGSRVVFSNNTRMLFMHITCPQHSASLALVDAIFSGFAAQVPMERQINTASYRTGASTFSCHYTYLAGVGTHPMHTSSPAVDWKAVPNCIYDAHSLMVGYQSYSVSENQPKVYEFNQSIFVIGNGANGTSIFRMVHRAEDGPIGYMVFGASCYIEILVGKGENKRRTTKEGSSRRAEMLLAHGDALFTSTPLPGDAPIEVRVKRTGLAIVAIARYVPPESLPTPTSAPSKAKKIERPAPNTALHPLEPNATPARGKKRKSRAASAMY